MKARILPAIAALLLASCAVGPNFGGAAYKGLPETWVNALPPASDDYVLETWWSAFGDPQLTSLIEQGFAANQDMVNAALNIARAESALRATKANLFPSVSGSAGGSNSGSYDSSTGHGRWNGSLSASWTPDIWGGTRREVEAAFAALGSTRAAAASTRTALASSIATAYFQWISAQESLRIAKEQLAYQERTYQATASRTAAGFDSSLDLAQATATIASTRSQIPMYEANIKSCENTLATLLGTTVDHISLTMPAAAVYNRIPSVPTGLPGDLLRRRPDIIAAEHNVHQACARVGVSVASLFPRVTLTGGTGGSAGTDFAGFWQSTTWNLGASVSQQLLNRTALRENVKQARLSHSSALVSYDKAVVSAFAEVENCLIDYARYTAQLPQIEATAAANRQAAELSMRRHIAGESDFLNVASAERAWLSSELNIISTRQSIRITLARLCTALGGGWK